MKKLFLLMLTFMFSASFLASCGNSSDGSDGEFVNASSDISGSECESTNAISDISANEIAGANDDRGPGWRPSTVVVQEVPEGFILLPRVQQFENGLSFMPWNMHWSVFDINRSEIFSAEILNTDFIVMYEGELYINEEKFLEIYAIADSAFEEYMRNQEESDTE